MRSTQTLVVVVAVAVAGLAGCGAGEEKAAGTGDANVATLQSAAPEPVASSKAPERPRERLDTTPEGFEALLVPYKKCLKENGIESVTARKALADSAEAGEAELAAKDCESRFYPLPPWEKDPANPEAKDFAVAVVKCLKQKGVEYVEVAEDGLSYALGGDRNDPRSISLGLEKAPECEREVAARS